MSVASKLCDLRQNVPPTTCKNWPEEKGEKKKGEDSKGLNSAVASDSRFSSKA